MEKLRGSDFVFCLLSKNEESEYAKLQFGCESVTSVKVVGKKGRKVAEGA
jgi:hypothetical protein